MAEKCAAEVWVCVDAAGDYAVGSSKEAAIESYEANIQALGDADGIRFVTLTVNVPLPAPVDVEVDVPELDGDAEPTVSVA